VTNKLKPESNPTFGPFKKQLVFPGTSLAPPLASVAQLVEAFSLEATGVLSLK
jgi:hypothetical protein